MNDFIRNYFRWKSWEKIFISFEFLVILILVSLLYFDFQNRLDAGTREEIGTITFKTRTVQRKYSDRAVWEPMENSFPLYNRDSIRTGDISDAEITLKDGTKLEIDENSLIVLNISKESKEIDFSYGSLTANSLGENTEVLKINMGDKQLSLNDSKVNVSQSTDKGVLVDVKEGFASLLSGGQDTKIDANEKVSIQENKIEKTEKPFRIIQPVPNYKSVFSGDKVNVEFVLEGWDVSNPGVLEFSRNRNFTNVLFKRNIPSAKFSETLVAGIYYWRAIQNGKISSIGKLNLIKINPSKLINPPNNSKIFMNKDKSFVSFAWTMEGEVGQYELEVSTDKSFTSTIHKKTVMGSSLSVELPAGEYYWRIRSNVFGDKEPVLSSIQSVILTREEITIPPILLHPKPGDELSHLIVKGTGIGFFWSPIRGYDSYELDISSRSDFVDSKILQTNNSNLIVKQDYLPGEYFWRVRGVTPSGKKGEYSKFFTLMISSIDKNLFNLQSDSSISEESVTKEGITLKWRKLPVNGTYEVTLAKDKDFNQVVKKIITNLNQTKIQELTNGKYFWKVSLLDENGNPSLVSEYKSLDVNNSIGPIQPRQGDRINMSNKDSLVFEWESRAGINNYTIIIYQNVTNGRREVLQKSTSSNKFIMNELELLDEGSFDWEIYYQELGERKKEFKSEFYITLDPLPDTLELLTPKIQYAD